jgi:ATP-dependent helicase/nuclease subunit A
MSLTPAQREAIDARGNVLVVAGAGTGKTRTLVERCLSLLLRDTDPVNVDELLLVTFTEAAAAEMRHRIRARVQEELQRQPGHPRCEEILGAFEAAHIGTLHSFCLDLIRQHFYNLDLDPQVSVLPAEEARLLAEDTLDTLLQEHYAGRGESSAAVQDLIQVQGRGRDRNIRRLVLQVHHFSQTLADAGGWFEAQLQAFGEARPSAWLGFLPEGIEEWRRDWLPVLEGLAASNSLAVSCVQALVELRPDCSCDALAAALKRVLDACDACPKGKKGAWLKPLKEFQADACFLLSLAARNRGRDPLGEDWAWARGHVQSLLGLAQEFTQRFSAAKHESGLVDFHDLEQHALRLLWDPETGQPTEIARHWREKLRFVFVDEYQDINQAQDKIIEALSRDGQKANRFLVGDVKQSIYRFRLANPRIFQRYAAEWDHAAHGRTIPLVDNFRSREGILDFVNTLFTALMQPGSGGVQYDEAARLRFGAGAQREQLSRTAGGEPCVELHLRLKGGSPATAAEAGAGAEAAESAGENDANGDLGDAVEADRATILELEEAEKEARLTALRLAELRNRKRPVWDEDLKVFRPVEWRDMAILLRAPSNKAESYAKEFARLQLPLQVARGGFYSSLEISDLVSLLHVLDNPLQDLPLVAVLHSPIAGLTPEQLATIRLASRKARFWSALLLFHKSGSGCADPGLRSRISTFLDQYRRWRRIARQGSLSRCLETVLAETQYEEWLLTQSRGEQRYANVQRLLSLARQFDSFQRQGVFRFLRFVEAQQAAESEPESAAAPPGNCVTLMSIHQSKGLEFPVVVVGDLGKPFNLADFRAEIILDDKYGLCPQVKPPHTGARYPSLPYWLACRRGRRETLSEELRLLYVACTRARDLLLLTGSIANTNFQNRWLNPDFRAPGNFFAAKSYADWLACWFPDKALLPDAAPARGKNEFLRWEIHEPFPQASRGDGAQTRPASVSGLPASASEWRQIEERLGWRYPWWPATVRPAKTSVSMIRRQAAVDETAAAFPGVPPNRAAFRLRSSKGGGTAAQIGTAHHKFLQWVAVENTGSVGALKTEARRLADLNLLTPEEIEVLDFARIEAFWASDPGRQIRSQAQFVKRELAFTAGFKVAELASMAGGQLVPSPGDEFVVVQGVADLVVLAPNEIWLVDFKTDKVSTEGIPGKVSLYQPQLQLYASALSGIYRRPVTRCWLYFLHPGKAMQLVLGQAEP